MKPLLLIGAALGGAMIAVGLLGWKDRDDAFTSPSPTAQLLEPLGEVSGARVSPPTIHPAGLMINAPLRTSTEENEELAFFGSFARTRLAFELVYPSGGLIDLARDECELTLFEDDRGLSLLPSDSFFGAFEMMPRIGEDGRSILVTVGTDKLPTANATRLRATGTVAVTVASEQGTDNSEPAALAVGTRYVAGPWTFEVTEAGPSEWNDNWTLAVQTTTDTAPIVSYNFESADGTLTELSPSMSMSGMGTWNQSLDSETPLENGRLSITYWKDSRRIEVPFEMTTGLGLAGRTSSE